MDWLVIAFRLIHIIAAALWFGGAALFFFYLEPTINKLGPDAEKFVDEVINKRKAPIYFLAISTIAVIGGIGLYYHDAGGVQLWTSPSGVVFTIGAIAGLLAWIGGNVLIVPAVMKVQAIGGEMKAVGGPPPAELVGRMHAAQERLRWIGLVDMVLLFIAIAAMASARYFG
jgi:putative copper export protein